MDFLNKKARKYIYEILGFNFFVLYLIAYFSGKKTNLKMSLKWVYNAKQIFEENFAHIGVSSLQGGLN